MTQPLSPAAQAVKDAVLALYSDEKVHEFGWQLDAPTVAAALRAIASEVYFKADKNMILSIASELEGL